MRRFSVICSALVLVTSASLVADSTISDALAAAKAKSGWGPRADYIGRYRVEVGSAGGSGVRGGELTMFIQEEFPGSEAPAGILNLRTKTNNDVVYLTEPKHRGSECTAIVKGGSFLGPTIGNAKLRMLRPGVFSGRVSTHGLGTIRARFVRFSKKAAQ